jgi:hypothetical protein
VSNLVVNLQIQDDQAEALAQLVKRIGLDELRQNAKNDDEAYLMRDAINLLAAALSDAGFAPR